MPDSTTDRYSTPEWKAFFTESRMPEFRRFEEQAGLLRPVGSSPVPVMGGHWYSSGPGAWEGVKQAWEKYKKSNNVRPSNSVAPTVPSLPSYNPQQQQRQVPELRFTFPPKGSRWDPSIQEWIGPDGKITYGSKPTTELRFRPSYFGGNQIPEQQQQTTQNLINAQNPVQPLNQFTMPQTPSAPSSPTMPSLPSYNRPSMLQGQYGMFGGSTASNAANPEGGVTNLPNLFEQLSPYRKFYQR